MARSNADKVARDYYEYKRRKEQQRLMREAKAGVPAGRAVGDALEEPKVAERKPAPQPAVSAAEDAPKFKPKPVEAPTEELEETQPESLKADQPQSAEDLPDRSAESEAFRWDVGEEPDEEDEDDEDDGNTVVKALQLAKTGMLMAGAAIGKGATWLSANARSTLAGIRQRRAKSETEEEAEETPSPDDDIYTYQYTPNRSLIGPEEQPTTEEGIVISGPGLETEVAADSPASPLDIPPLWREEQAQNLSPDHSQADWMADDEPESPRKSRVRPVKPKWGVFSLFSRDERDGAEDDIEMAESNARDAYQEGIGFMDKQQKPATTMTDLLAEDLGETPVLSRRERRALAEAQESKKPEPSQPPMPDSLSSDDFQVDEPTVEFTPIRARRQQETVQETPAPAKPWRPAAKPLIEYDDDDDVDDEDEEEEPIRRPAKKAQPPKPPKRRVYDDEEDDDDEDEDDDDDFDDDDDYDDRGGIGKRILGFLKGLIVIGLILLLAVLALRLTEANGAISLNGLRSTVGGVIPYVNTLFPEPSVHPVTTAAPDDGAQPTDAGDMGGAADSGDTTSGDLSDAADSSDAA